MFEHISDGTTQDYYTITLSDVAVLSISQSDPQDTIIKETIVLQALKYAYTFTPPPGQGGAGPVTFSYDCTTGQAQ